MNPVLRGIIAVIAGIAVGSVVNMGIITLVGAIIPLPPGSDTSTTEGMRAAITLFETRHFAAPFLGHALGTLVGAFVAALIVVRHRIRFGLGIALFFLAGGIVAVFMLHAPMWFNVVDLVFAYIPMGYLGAKLVDRK